MRIEPEIRGVQIVLLGEFNPAIFSPAWFAHNQLLRESVAENAQLQVIHPQITDFTADWLHLQVSKDRFTAETQQAPSVRLRDLVFQVFSDQLNHTPLTAFGINHNFHFLVRDLAERDRIGNTLVPPEAWGQWRTTLDLDSPHGGMTGVRISQLRPSGRTSGGQINITVEPSAKIGGGGRGVYVSVNDHFVTSHDQLDSATRLMDTLAREFEASVRQGEKIVDHIMSLSEESRG